MRQLVLGASDSARRFWRVGPSKRVVVEPQRSSSDYKSQVLQATELVELIGKTVALKKRGKNYLGLCPFHSEKSPSFNVDPGKQFFHCFGCKASGDAISFVMKRDRVEFLDALHLLGDAAGIERPNRTGLSKEKAGERQRLLDAQSAAAAVFQKSLWDPSVGVGGRDYLASRGFSDEVVRKFQIGLAVDGWDHLLRHPAMKPFPPQLLAIGGLVKTRESGSGFYDTFRNRIMFPIRDENGRVIAFGGRVMPGSTDKAKYLNSPETPLFVKNRCVYGLDFARQKVVESRTVAVVEGYADVVMAHQYGATNVVSVLGTALTEGHVGILRRFADRIVLLFDADAAGDTAVNRAVELFLTQPVEVAIAAMPDGVDPDEYLVAHGAEAFDSVLKTAADALTYTWKRLSKAFNESGDDLTGQQKAVSEYLELLASARATGPVDSIRWGSALSRVSRLTDIPVEELNKRFRKPAATRRVQRDVEPTPVAAVVNKPRSQWTGRDTAERWILAVLLVEPQRWHDVQIEIGPERFTDPIRKQLAEIYWSHQRDEGEPVFNEFLGTLPEGLVRELAIELVDEADGLGDAASRLRDALAYFDRQAVLEKNSKHVAELRRTSSAGGGLSTESLEHLKNIAAAAGRRSGV